LYARNVISHCRSSTFWRTESQFSGSFWLRSRYSGLACHGHTRGFQESAKASVACLGSVAAWVPSLATGPPRPTPTNGANHEPDLAVSDDCGVVWRFGPCRFGAGRRCCQRRRSLPVVPRGRDGRLWRRVSILPRTDVQTGTGASATATTTSTTGRAMFPPPSGRAIIPRVRILGRPPICAGPCSFHGRADQALAATDWVATRGGDGTATTPRARVMRWCYVPALRRSPYAAATPSPRRLCAS
jgi:hypothetical protein